ncbi:diketogulonate reductase-like aldo/keto reductase [Halanaerobium saccharolyticum]|jgi:diketogulonate reductase-like aldo/keto reductase|uniref:Diketogulonate reductase-like aldo/keto reductase n=1 Tax=Halanaerobium saccharolyticum TaxID=43595 RepID=A0A2T5RLP2_9FIRM|nr:aldo/keto reductase [Halanaerobium saccharolyticum]OEG62844.1 MAG: oxidoreductase [Halanaerobium sp. MDAL1]PTW00176.1 diketogulonate reductase-like aldo/keto reductase [Halanaerobium saccharolyticum]TDP93556.1 diketogulonate reductase-like aldo/keto reductase [Halanaerobium saccharolyticum]
MIPTRKLKTGDEIPVIAYGTWDIAEENVGEKVEIALKAGYNHIDTAEGYHNEAGIGEVLKDYDRDELFITSKVLPSNLNYESVIKACKRSLEKLGTDYLDLYLIHWPNPAISLRETLQAMKYLVDEGLVKNIGVSNFSVYQLKVALKITPVPITVNQVEFHPWLYQKELLEVCDQNDVVIEASAPLARTEVLSDETILELADKYDKSPAQIVLKWELQKGIVPLPKSKSEGHIKENLELFDWELKAEDMAAIDNIDHEKRVYMITLDDETYGISS